MSGRESIGRLRQRVTLEAPQDAADGAGGMTRTYVLLAQVWAQVTPTGAEAEFAQQRQEQAISHSVRIRWRDDVVSQMRVLHRGRKLLVRAVHDEDERRRFLLLRCEEIAS